MLEKAGGLCVNGRSTWLGWSRWHSHCSRRYGGVYRLHVDSWEDTMMEHKDIVFWYCFLRKNKISVS